MKRAVLDHVAIGTRRLTDGWQLFGGLLGGTWVYGGDSPGYWWGQLRFAAGPKIELLTPTSGPDGAFLERFLTSHGAGPHHLTFLVGDISQTLSAVRALGIEPVGVNLSNPAWKEAFLHPRDAYGIVVQLAEQSATPRLAPPAELPEPGPTSAFALVEHHVTDLYGATRLFAELLNGELVTPPDSNGAPTVELAWQNGTRLRLVGATTRRTRLHFTREGAPLSPAELSTAADLASRLGTSIRLTGSPD